MGKGTICFIKAMLIQVLIPRYGRTSASRSCSSQY
jgi:hypothetical protein